MSLSLENNKRIAKNTLLLYVRMLFNLIVTLYTSRVILQALGIEDMGIYNVVGGIVTMSQVVTSSISNAISRFLTFELGSSNILKLKKTFSLSVTVLLILAAIIFIIVEIGGIYFIDKILNISENRLYAAHFVLLFSALTFCVNLISVPYNASIISHEKMNVYAYIGIFEVIMKLLVAYLIMIVSSIDHLMLYAISLFGVSLIIRIFYGIYCGKSFIECKYSMIWDKAIIKELFHFASWNFLENIANVFKSQGVSILINVFFGATINAAQAIANQVSNAIQQFSTNFITAVSPQIIKLYAENQITEMLKLTSRASRFSFYITLIIAFPIICNLSFILHLWLTTVPQYTDTFILLIIVWILIEVLAQPIVRIILATGNIKQYQIGISFIMFSNFPLSYLALQQGMGPNSIYWISALTCLMALIYRLISLKQLIKNINIADFSKRTLVAPLLLGGLAISMFILLRFMHLDILFNIIISFFIGEIILILSIYKYGVNENERKFIVEMIYSKLNIKLQKSKGEY